MSGANRIAGKGRLTPAKTARFTFDGKSYTALEGDTVASALIANGIHLVGRSFKYHRPRGILSAGAEEPNALIDVARDSARKQPNVRATVQEVAEIERAWQALRDAEGDLDAFTKADVAFHAGLLKASHNQVFMQLASIIQAALEFSLHASNEAADARDEAVEIHRRLVEALRMRDRAAARECSHRMLDIAARDIAIAVRNHPAPAER